MRSRRRIAQLPPFRRTTGPLELRHRGTILADPRVLTVELVSRSRKDIRNEAYNDHQPLQLDVSSRIVEILHVTSEPGILPVPKLGLPGPVAPASSRADLWRG